MNFESFNFGINVVLSIFCLLDLPKRKNQNEVSENIQLTRRIQNILIAVTQKMIVLPAVMMILKRKNAKIKIRNMRYVNILFHNFFVVS